ncbi:MAG: protein translocase subunit SecF, partial [Gammaproteobacteria bacterium]|nr:protein translocase subunit SecF [Gammaproteobacteria bacterium]
MTFTIDFMRFRFIAMALSGTVLVISIVSLLFFGINRGLDFTGGVLVELGFVEPTDANEIREVLGSRGFPNVVVQNFGSELDIGVRVPPTSGIDQSNVGNEIIVALESSYPGVVLRRSEYVGPAVGQELTEKGGLALLVALAVVMVYIMLRFTGKFAIGAVIALVHDILIVVGVFATFGMTFNLTELAALLAVIGYSLNDTIV